jgi:hypothetical protein
MKSPFAACILLLASTPLACSDDPDEDPTSGSDEGDDGDDESDDGSTPGGDVGPDELQDRSACIDGDGAGVDHTGTISADETWSAADGPHRIPSELVITATVTVEPCALVQIGPQVYVYIEENGSLVAHGDVSTNDDGDVEVRPVHFDTLESGSNWGQILVAPDGTIDLSVAALLDGGDAPINAQGALVLQGVAGGTNSGDIVRNGALDRVLVSGSAGTGINLDAFGGFTEESSDVWIRECGRDDQPYPLQIEPGIAQTLPAGLDIQGNVLDEILVQTSKTFMPSDTFADHGVPYHVMSALYVAPPEDGAAVTLTIEPGVVMKFEEIVGSGLVIGSGDAREGLLVAEGTAEDPILFTSGGEAVAGAWQGFFFRYTPTSGNAIRHARIEFAGSDSGYNSFGCGPGDNDAAIIIEGQGPDDVGPGDVFVTDTEFNEIGGETVIVSGWTDDAGPDFSAGNTFGAVTPSCKVSRPKRSGTGDLCDGGRDMCWGS